MRNAYEYLSDVNAKSDSSMGLTFVIHVVDYDMERDISRWYAIRERNRRCHFGTFCKRMVAKSTVWKLSDRS